MAGFLVRARVENFVKWKSVFDEHSNKRKSAGSKRGYAYRNVDDSDEIQMEV